VGDLSVLTSHAIARSAFALTQKEREIFEVLKRVVNNMFLKSGCKNFYMNDRIYHT
jgi:hypothetical protein